MFGQSSPPEEEPKKESNKIASKKSKNNRSIKEKPTSISKSRPRTTQSQGFNSLNQRQTAEDGLNTFYESSASSGHEDADLVLPKKKSKSDMFFSSSDKEEDEVKGNYAGGDISKNTDDKDRNQGLNIGKTGQKKTGGSNGPQEQETDADENEEGSEDQASQEFLESEYEPNSEDPLSSDDNEWGKRKGR